MSPEHWQEIKDILRRAPEEAAARDAYLTTACGDDQDLRREVESFLAHEDEVETFVERPIASVVTEPPIRAPEQVGPYRIVRVLAIGGMGEVYLAEREVPFHQTVALKLLRPELARGEALYRFENERQILARLEHPYMARLLDGGTTNDGRPWLALTYVEGRSIDKDCDARCLGVEARIELVLQVCEALAYAHQSLIVHRDLKPSNILVDTDGTPKLLDFGIAKILDPGLAPHDVRTHTGMTPMTPRYASPEVVEGGPITTRSDIYSLGLVLYELLTGRLPCGLATCRPYRAAEIILRQEPRRPSTQVGRGEDILKPDGSLHRLTPEEVGAARGCDPERLRRHLAGDLDAIVLKALRKEPEKRYASVEQLAEDLRNFLDGRPVTARQGTALYVTGKLVRRYRWRLVAGTAIFGLLGTLATVEARREWQRVEVERQRAEVERQRAEQVAGFLEDLILPADPDTEAERSITPASLLDRGREKLEELEGNPEIVVRLYETLGKLNLSLGRNEIAAELYEEALSIWRDLHPEDSSELARNLNNKGSTLYTAGQLDAAEEHFRDALAMRARLGQEGDEIVTNLNNLANVRRLQGDFDEAETLLRRGLEIRIEVGGRESADVATSLRHLGALLLARGDLEGAEVALREALELRTKLFGTDHTQVASVADRLGCALLAQGHLEEAEALLKQGLDIRSRRLADGHVGIAQSRAHLAALHLARGELEDARAELEQSLPILRDKQPGQWQVADTESLEGELLMREGRYREAEVVLVSSHRALAELLGDQAFATRQAFQRLENFRERSLTADETPPPRH